MASAITTTSKIPGSKSNDDIESVKHADLDGKFFIDFRPFFLFHS
jgi:hypothetical protein